MSLFGNALDGSPASPVVVRGTARRRDAFAAAAVCLVTLLAAGSGWPQEPRPSADTSALFRQGTIHEMELPIPRRETAPVVRESVPGTGARAGAAPSTAAPASEFGAAAVKEPDGSYDLPPLHRLAGARGPQQDASMKLIREGRTLLHSEDYEAALARFERAVGIDAINPYIHYFIARAHYFLQNYADSLSFLDVAESKLGADAGWLAEVHVLRARNAAAAGFHGRADFNYIRALRLAPRHAFALAQITTVTTTGDARGQPQAP